MAFRLDADERAASGLRRVTREQIDRSVRALRNPGDDGLDEAIHDARKRCKRVRASLRLVRRDLGDKTYRAENACFRDVARMLSPARDAHVLVETLDRVHDHFRGQLDDHAFAAIRKVLDERRREMVTDDDAAPGAAEEAAAALEAAADRVPGWPLGAEEWSALAPGLERTYSAGRDAMVAAVEPTDSVAYHEWRKQVKYVWHQIQLIASSWPEVLEPTAEEAHRLADDLGEAHDLALLRLALADEPDLGGDPVAVEALVGLVERRREHFQRAAHVRGQRLYAEPADAFLARVAGYWRACRAG